MGQKKRPQKKQYVIYVTIHLYYALGRTWCFVFGSWGVCKLPQAVLQRVDGICDASLASRGVPYLLGEHKS